MFLITKPLLLVVKMVGIGLIAIGSSHIALSWAANKLCRRSK